MSSNSSTYPTNQPIIGTANNPALLATQGSAAPVDGSSTPRTARPDYTRPEYDAALPALHLCRDLMDGTQAVQAAGTKYLPKHPKETAHAYEVRRTVAEVFRAFQRTVQAAVGMITATPATLVTDDAEDGTVPDTGADAAPQAIADDWEDIDLHGTHGEVFAKQIAEEGLVSGLMAILVDAPPRPDGIDLNGRDEIDLNLRPFWVKIPRDRILSWIVETPDWKAIITRYKAGEITADQAKAFARQLVLRQVVLYEPTDVRTNDFGVTCVDRYRVITLTDTGVEYRVEEKRKNDRGDYFVTTDAGRMTGAKGKPLSAIPLALGYAGRKRDPLVVDLPMLALAELNIGHYRVSAGRRYLMELCHAPTLTLIGIDENDGQDDEGRPIRREFNVGPNSVIVIPTVGGDAKWVAADPRALDSSQTEKDDLLKQMAALGMSFLSKDRRGNQETALGRRLDDAAENATHATAARALQDVLEQALKFHAEYRGVSAPSASVPTSYASDAVDPQLAGVLWQAVVADRLPMEAFLEYVQTGKLPDEIDLDSLTEIRLVKEQIAAQQKRDTLAALTGGTPPAGTDTKAETTADDPPAKVA